MAKAQANFEHSIAELENLVQALEGDELTLDESLKVFEKGVKLSRSCQKILDQAELKIQKLSDEQWQDVEVEVALDSGSVVHVCTNEDGPGYKSR